MTEKTFNYFNIIPEDIFFKISYYLKFDDILNLKITNKLNNNFLINKEEIIFIKMLENSNYYTNENNYSFNIHRDNFTYSITKSNNIKTIADVIKKSNFKDIY
jgi:hypothetical protein